MQTFLPYPNFVGSARVLDSRRLGKQRVENLQIMQTLLGYRVSNTHRPMYTGEFRKAFFDKDRNEVPLDELDMFDFWYEDTVPVTCLVATPKEEWTIELYDAGGWRNHPAVLMWEGYPHVLMAYQDAICDEWTDRTFKDTCREKTRFLYRSVMPEVKEGYPEWLGDEEFHRSHQSNLLRKHPNYYKQFFHNVPNHLPYVWPVSSDSREKQAL